MASTKARGKREEASAAQPLLCVLLLTFISMFLMFSMRLALAEYTSLYFKDGLNAAVMAGLMVNEEELGISGDVVIDLSEMDGTLESYASFLDALKDNLNLDSAMEAQDSTVVNGSKVTVEEYRIYNVSGTSVTEITVDPQTGSWTAAYAGETGRVTTPGGNTVTDSGIYAQITYQTRGFYGADQETVKSAFLDVAQE